MTTIIRSSQATLFSAKSGRVTLFYVKTLNGIKQFNWIKDAFMYFYQVCI